jgi:hypothetical protein
MRRAAAASLGLAAAIAAGCVYSPKGRCGADGDCAAGLVCTGGVCVAPAAATPAVADPTAFATVSWSEHLSTPAASFAVDGIGADLAGTVVVAGAVDVPFDFGPGPATTGAFAVALPAEGGAPLWAFPFPTFSHGAFVVAVRPDTGETFFAGTVFAPTTVAGTALAGYVPPEGGALVLGKLDATGLPVWATAAPGSSAAALAPVSLAVHGGDVLLTGTGGVSLGGTCPDTAATPSGSATFVAALDGATGVCRWARGFQSRAIAGAGAGAAASGTVTVGGLCQPVGASFDPGAGTTCASGLWLAALDGATGAPVWDGVSAGGTVAAVRDLAVAPDGRATLVGDARGAVDLGGGPVDFGSGSERSFAATFSPSGAFSALVRAIESPDAASPDVAAFSRATYDAGGRLWIAGRYEGAPSLGGVRFSACRAPACAAAAFLARIEADGSVSPAGGFLPIRAARDAGGAAWADDLVLCATTGTVAAALRLEGNASVGGAPTWAGVAGDLAAVRVAP